MTKLLHYMVLMVLIWPSKLTGAFQLFGFDSRVRRAQQDQCKDQEYLNGGICCLNCPAGYHLISPCTKEGQRGQCEECQDGTYTEHPNGLKQCFKCTQCPTDQQIKKPCTHTQDTECQCLPGTFCAPDQPCEVCLKCSSCGKGEEIVRNCNATANTQCKKIQSNPDVPSAKLSVIVQVTVLAAALLIIFVLWVWRRKIRDSLRNQPIDQKAGELYSENCLTEEKGKTDTQKPSRSNLMLSGQLEDKEFPKLVPVNGEESLKKCFEYFEEMDLDYHKRFFRHIGIADNVIKSKEHLHCEDKIHELLNIWMEKEGRKGSLNDLLTALLALNQRRTAETIKENAIHHGHYLCEY
ncbi:tumor necrosis factor receptor superfamily member 10B-like [Xyrichtys novacula]|uniref:Tumor necrosis factor receptor superfamily member 10B-like n=1 Tax=Xyrichtys novacula TaxID=13765 RepID=A0AAV1G8W2_XYRNO|nr:tumor necrosis factor receptor superfamily member 10B-like [Xyrichtys novacula]